MTRPIPQSGTKATIRSDFRLRIDRRDDSGLSLVELMIALASLIMLMTLVGISLDGFLNVSNQVQTSYANSSQLIPVATAFQRLVRSEVEPGPVDAAGKPSPPFAVGAVTANSATFYSNVGVAGQPAKVVAALSGGTFTVTDQLADAGTCPLSVASTAVCTFNNNPAKRVASIADIVNSSYPSTGSPTPVFTYTLLDPSGGGAGTQETVSDTSVFNSCTASSDLAISCPGDAVQGVEIDLLIKSPGSKALNPAEDDTVVYRLSSNSYLYSPTVG